MKLFDKVKDFVGVDSYDEEYYEDDYEVEEEPERHERPRLSRGRDNLVPMETRHEINMDLMISHPAALEDATKFVDVLKERRPVIINFSKLDQSGAQEILHFMSGAIYALGGRVKKVDDQIYVFAPKNVELSSFSGEDKSDEVDLNGDMWR